MTNNEIQNSTERVKGKKFTNAQRAAISYSGKALLLSAGAGSGKTATLTEKVCRMVCNEDSPADLSRMIIVTFTKLAASELRERIGKAISEKLRENPDNTYLARQLVALESAQISTNDSFFYKIIKPHFSLLGLPPSFKIMEETNGAVIKERIMEDIIDESFESGDKAFFRLAESLSGSRDEKSLVSTVIEIDNSMSVKGYGAEKLIEWAKNISVSTENDFFTTSYGKVIQKNTITVAKHFFESFSYIERELEKYPSVKEKYSITVDAAKEYAIMLSQAASKGYEETKAALSAYSLPNYKRLAEDEKNALTEFASNTKSSFREEVKKLKENYFCESAESLAEICEETSSVCLALSKIIGEFRRRYENEKKDRAAVDFFDLSQYAHRLFCNSDGTPTTAAAEFSKNYDYIFIDEYQDTNRIQDEIFAAVSCKMKQRFMVGDVKQSIYAFRGGEPSVFANYRNIFANIGEDELKYVESGEDLREMCIFMSENFRSDKYVIDYVNTVSEYVFKGTPTPFEEGDKLICGKTAKEGDEAFPVEVCIVKTPDKKSEDALPYRYENCEAEYVAEKISRLLENGKKASGEPILPKDIAILLQCKTHMKDYTDALIRRGIPVNDTSCENFFGQGEILLVLCILNTIDNPLRDVYLAGTMKSPVFGFTMSDMVKLGITKGPSPLWFAVADYGINGTDEELRLKCASFCEIVTALRTKSKSMSAAELLRTLYDTLSLFSIAKSESDNTPSPSVRRNLIKLYEYARSFEEESFGGLFDFINYIEELMKKDDETQNVRSDENSVTVMTVHKSKGLEFPVCFLAECDTKIARTDKSPMLFNADIGPAPKLRDRSGLVLCDTPLRKTVSQKNKTDTVYEQMRLLYVAMTRAVERLFVVFKSGNPDKDVKNAEKLADFTTEYERNTFKSFSSMILPPTLRLMKESPEKVTLTVCDCYDIEETCRKSEDSEKESDQKNAIDVFEERLNFKYPFDYLNNIPSKVTVSKLRPKFLDDEEEVTLSIDGYKQNSAKKPTDIEKRPIPKFIVQNEKVKPTDIGTATHVFLQFCDFKSLSENGFDAELERLLSHRFITKEMASLVSRPEIEAFAASRLFSSVLESNDVRREFRFNVALPAASFTSNEELAEKLNGANVDIIAQGVIDLVYTDKDGKLVLVDYKTDRLSDYEIKNRKTAEEKLVGRHKSQLSYYAIACEKMFCRKVDSVLIFSLALGDTVSVI